MTKSPCCRTRTVLSHWSDSTTTRMHAAHTHSSLMAHVRYLSDVVGLQKEALSPPSLLRWSGECYGYCAAPVWVSQVVRICLGSCIQGERRYTRRVVFVGGKPGTPPSLDLTFPPTGLSENLGGMERGRGGKGEREGWRDHLPYFPPLASASNTPCIHDIGGSCRC